MYKNIFSKKLAFFILGGVLCKRVTTNYFKFINTDYFNSQKTQELQAQAKLDQQLAKATLFSKYIYTSIKKHILLGSNILFFLMNLFKEKNIMRCEGLKKPYLGCSLRSKDEGMQVILIKSESPAERAGLMVKDIILEIDGKKVSTIHDYNAAIGSDITEKKTFKILRRVDGKDIIMNIDIQLVYNE
jgi:predicted metalloprotease with PDZ domain